MEQLPNAENAIVPQPKITRYLLDLTSEHGEPKARFFLAFGFTIELWHIMAEALKEHALSHPVSDTRTTPFGINYVIEGKLRTPDKRNPEIRSIWQIKTNDKIPYFVTAYPK